MSHTHSDYSLLAVKKHRPTMNGAAVTPAMDIEEIFGENAFDLEEMKSRLPKDAYKSLKATIKQGRLLDPKIADTVAMAMKEWAVERGATHYTHWFQPLTGNTAEKHDSFITPNRGGGAIAQFSGKELIQGEPDASSFPSGGLRATFEARGYTAWDPTSPAFIVENDNGSYLAIPTAFASWSGEALDHKTPLLRSMKTINEQASRALTLFGVKDAQVVSTVGCEQEYFLIDEEFFYRRPDLMATGRTLLGTKPPRGQELDDHYFGSIPDRVLACMLETEKELYRLAIPVKTRHNEVAPSQYEIAPIFENTNVAADHQQLMMITLQRVARKYGLVCLLHEKPFRGVNGSGKHNNWSLATESGMNLLEPGDNPHDNLQFLFFCSAVVKAVWRHQDLLRISVATAANDHRLGANEAPPAIISVFLGDQLEDVFEQIEAGAATSSKQAGLLGLGTPVLPDLSRHAGDRNRTSPFAFTGNKFEFRAPGSSQTISFVNTVLNTIVAEAVDEMATELEVLLADGTSLETAVGNVVRGAIKESRNVIFGGDNYSEQWHEEAERRGLLNLKTTVDALNRLLDDQNIALFEKYNVLSESELRSREEVWVEQYFLRINIEGELTETLARTYVMPAATKYLRSLLRSIKDCEVTGVSSKGVRTVAEHVAAYIDELQEALRVLIDQNKDLGGDTVHDKARHMVQDIIPAMDAVRHAADRLERTVDHDLWRLPTYRDMLFVK